MTSDLAVHNGNGALSESVGWQLVQQAQQLLDQPVNADEAQQFFTQVRAVEEAMKAAQLSSAAVVAMGRVRLRAWARWGELLGAPRPGRRRGDGPRTPMDQRAAEYRARRLAQAKALDPDAFERYLSEDHNEPPTQAGVLRAIKRATGAAVRVPPSTTTYSDKHGRSETVILLAFTVKRPSAETHIELMEQLNDEWEGRKLSGNARVIQVDLV